MKVEFLKDHVNHAKGEIVSDHPNAAYLITLGVAKEVKEKVSKPKK